MYAGHQDIFKGFELLRRKSCHLTSLNHLFAGLLPVHWFQGGGSMRKRNCMRHQHTIGSVKRSLENRIVLCVDCEANRVLTLSPTGNLICSSCGSEHWMHLSVTQSAGFAVRIPSSTAARHLGFH